MGLHAHVGAGKLGLGLAVPALAQGTRRAVVLQAPIGPWRAFATEAAPRPLRLSAGDASVELAVAAGPGAVEWATSEAGAERGRPAVVVADVAAWGKILAAAESLSTAVGGDVLPAIAPVLRDAIPEGKKVPTYGLENDHRQVRALAKTLGSRALVCPCLVDRVCSTLTVDDDVAAVGVEDFQGLIMPLHSLDAPFPFGGPAVRIAGSEAAAQFVYHRKLLLVNGLHTALAFSTLAEAAEDEREPSDLALVPLAPVSALSEERAAKLRTWAVALALQLLLDHPADVVHEALGVESPAEVAGALMAYIDATFARLSASAASDTVGRVLHAGVLARFDERLKRVSDRLTREVMLDPARLEPVQLALLERAGLDNLQELATVCFTFVRELEVVALSVSSDECERPP